MFPLTQWLEIATQAAYKGGDILRHYWGNLKEVSEKNFPGDIVTEADKHSEKVILEHLLMHFPEHQILAEESGLSSQESEFIWMVDPLDGTTNYSHQFPFVAVSIGLAYRQEPILGVVYNPILNELFLAARGLGATFNGKPIHVSKNTEFKSCLLATGFSYDRQTNVLNNYAEFCHFTQLTQGVRRAGAAALDLSYVACGRLDGFWEKGLKAWDIAAGTIIIREAGGQVSNYDLQPLNLNKGPILASNGHIHAQMSKELIALRMQNPINVASL